MKRTLLIFILFVKSLSLFSQCELNNGLIHHYEFNGTLVDTVGSNNASGLVGNGLSYTTDRFGQSGKAIAITNNNRSVSPASPITMTTDMTISFWAKFTAQPANSFIAQIITMNNNSGIFQYGDYLSNSSVMGAFGMLYNNGFSGVYDWASPQPLNTWQHVVIIKQDSLFSLYINKNFVLTHKPYYYSASTTSITRLFGRESQATNPIGAFDDYRIYNRALSAQELDSLYSASVHPAFTEDLSSLTLCPGSTIDFITASHQNANSFNWYKDNTLLSYTHADTLTFFTHSANDAGNYFVVAENICGLTDTSNTIAVTYNTTNLNTGINGHYANIGGNPNPSNCTVGSISTLNTGTGSNFNVQNRFGVNGSAYATTLKSGGCILQNQLSDSTVSISLWYQYSNANAGSTAYILGTPNGASSSLAINSNGIIGFMNGATFYNGIDTLQNQIWYHIVVIKNGTHESIYVNDHLSLSSDNAPSLASNPIKYIANTVISNVINYSALGSYDDLRFYHNPISANEVHALYSELILAYHPLRMGGSTAFSASLSVCDNSSVELYTSSYTSNTQSPVYYQWYFNNLPLSNTGNFHNTNTSRLRIDTFTSSIAGVYHCVIRQECSSISTSGVTLNFDATEGPNIQTTVTQPNCVNVTGSVSFAVSGNNLVPNNSNPYIYQGANFVSNPHTGISPGAYVYRVYSDNYNCYSTATVVLNPANQPVSIYEMPGAGTCSSGIVQVAITSCDSINANTWQHIYSEEGKVIASINSHGQDLGLVTVTLYNESENNISQNTDLVPFSAPYSSKRWVITSEVAPTSPVNIRFYYADQDLVHLKSGSNCIDCNDQDIIISHVSSDNEDCSAITGTISNIDIFWNKNPYFTSQEMNTILGYTNGSVGNFYGNQSIDALGGCASNQSAFNGKYVEIVVNHFSEFRMHMLSNTPLPISFTSFTAEWKNEKIELNWHVADEKNIEHYIVEKSYDAATWSEISKVVAQHAKSASYTYFDEEKNNNVWYYRIKQVDINQNEHMSIIRKMVQQKKYDFVLYPNPTENELNISNKQNANALVTIFNIEGKLMYQSSLQNGINRIRTDLWAKGTYIIKITGLEINAVQKIQKQ
ncbi:MAG: LamG-like jellyroll fold domain-containing protein [Chitinophagaceae bacterium]